MRLVDYQLQNNTDFLCVLGTTAETPTLAEEEKKKIKKMVIERVNGKIPILLGVGGNNTRAIVETLKNDDFTGVDAILSVVPYYNKPSQEGIYQHYKAISEATDLPIVLYNVPGRTGCNIQPETVATLVRENENIVGLKEATGNMAQASKTMYLCDGKLDLYSGEDGLVVPLMAIGGIGVISVIANIAPQQTHDMCASYMAGDREKALELQMKSLPLVDALFSEVNPIPVKRALNLLGMEVGSLRAPLCEMSDANAAVLKQAMVEYGLL